MVHCVWRDPAFACSVLLSDAFEEGEALSSSQPFIINLLQFGGPAVSCTRLPRELCCLIKAVHDAVVPDREVGVGVFDELHRVTRGGLQEPDEKDRPAGRWP